MNGTLAFVFPGQASQSAGMGKELAAAFPAARAVLDAVEAGDSPLARGADVRRVRAALGRLEGLGLVRRDGLGGYERTGAACQRS